MGRPARHKPNRDLYAECREAAANKRAAGLRRNARSISDPSESGIEGYNREAEIAAAARDRDRERALAPRLLTRSWGPLTIDEFLTAMEARTARRHGQKEPCHEEETHTHQ